MSTLSWGSRYIVLPSRTSKAYHIILTKYQHMSLQILSYISVNLLHIIFKKVNRIQYNHTL